MCLRKPWVWGCMSESVNSLYLKHAMPSFQNLTVLASEQSGHTCLHVVCNAEVSYTANSKVRLWQQKWFPEIWTCNELIYFLIAMEYLVFPLLDKNLKINCMYFHIELLRVAGCYYSFERNCCQDNKEHTDVFCATVDLSEACGRINIVSPCRKLKATCLLEQIIELIGYNGITTFFCTSYKGCLSYEWKVGIIKYISVGLYLVFF